MLNHLGPRRVKPCTTLGQAELSLLFGIFTTSSTGLFMPGRLEAYAMFAAWAISGLLYFQDTSFLVTPGIFFMAWHRVTKCNMVVLAYVLLLSMKSSGSSVTHKQNIPTSSWKILLKITVSSIKIWLLSVEKLQVEGQSLYSFLS